MKDIYKDECELHPYLNRSDPDDANMLVDITEERIQEIAEEIAQYDDPEDWDKIVEECLGERHNQDAAYLNRRVV